MPEIKKLVSELNNSSAIVDSSIKSHANDPYVLKKVERAKQIVQKFGLPEIKKK